MSDSKKTFLAALAGGFVAMVFASGMTAWADGNPGTDGVPRVIPYQGTLEKDGAGVTGQVQMTFRIFDGAGASTAAWTEVLPVEIYAGRFQALLGSTSTTSGTNLAKAINNADDLYLGVSVTTGTGEVPLSNRQRFLPVPYAMWSTAATDFKVGKNLTVDGTAGVSGALTVGGTAGVTGALKVGGSLNTTITNQAIEGSPALLLNSTNKADVVTGGKLRVMGYDFEFDPLDDSVRGDGGRALVLNGGEVLTLNFEGDFSGGTRVQGDILVVDGRIESGNMSCRSGCANVSWVEAPGGGAFGSWRGRAYCPAKTYVCGLEQKVEGDQGSGGDDTATNSIAMLCCPF
jgi:hypothetical protein